ncbi:hypothetical protein AAHA92_25292 [Salvia divinorum]|uniref:Uncharacterized protein n=1 Tax=Salvia divinorum TaxID=28513 RepID=A0ABD1GA59_SALDI
MAAALILITITNIFHQCSYPSMENWSKSNPVSFIPSFSLSRFQTPFSLLGRNSCISSSYVFSWELGL